MNEQITISKAEALDVIASLIRRRNAAEERNNYMMAHGFKSSAYKIAQLLKLEVELAEMEKN
jgi:hypothetical protein